MKAAIMTFSDRMKTEAIAHGLCKQWTEEWKDNETKDGLIDKFVNGLDFCIKNDWPSLKDMEEFGLDEINARGIYCNQDVNLHNPDRVILNGNCNAVITLDVCTCEVWVRHNSKVTIHARRASTVFVRMLDSADVSVTTSLNSRAFTYKYSEGVVLTKLGKVIERDRIGLYKKA